MRLPSDANETIMTLTAFQFVPHKYRRLNSHMELIKLMNELIDSIWCDTDRMQRLVFGVYWMNAEPSFEVFYLASSVDIDLACIAQLETTVIGLLETGDATCRALHATFLASSEIDLSEAEIACAGWRVITLTPCPEPAPEPAPAPEPVPAPDPPPWPMPPG